MEDFGSIAAFCKGMGLDGLSLVIAVMLILFCIKYGPSIIQGHLEHLRISGETQKALGETNSKIATTIDKLDEKLGARMEMHGQAITHTADGLLAHVDGRPDEAKQFAAKAKDAVR